MKMAKHKADQKAPKSLALLLGREGLEQVVADFDNQMQYVDDPTASLETRVSRLLSARYKDTIESQKVNNMDQTNESLKRSYEILQKTINDLKDFDKKSSKISELVKDVMRQSERTSELVRNIDVKTLSQESAMNLEMCMKSCLLGVQSFRYVVEDVEKQKALLKNISKIFSKIKEQSS